GEDDLLGIELPSALRDRRSLFRGRVALSWGRPIPAAKWAPGQPHSGETRRVIGGVDPVAVSIGAAAFGVAQVAVALGRSAVPIDGAAPAVTGLVRVRPRVAVPLFGGLAEAVGVVFGADVAAVLPRAAPRVVRTVRTALGRRGFAV